MTEHVQAKGSKIPAVIPQIIEKEGVHLPPENSLALRLFKDTSIPPHHHPTALPLLSSSQRKTGSAGEKNKISKLDTTSTTATRDTGRKSSSSSAKSGRSSNQEASQEEEHQATVRKTSTSSSSYSNPKTETYLHWARLEARPVTPLPGGVGSSSSSSSSTHTTSSSTTLGWSQKGMQGAQTFHINEGDTSPPNYFARDSSATAGCASRTFVQITNSKLKGKTTAGRN
jgi:hypothetical protein